MCVPGSDYAQLSSETWKFFHNLYGGGPELLLRQQQSQPSASNNISLGAKQHSFESLAASKTGPKGRKLSAKSKAADDDCIQSCSPPTQQRLCRANSSNSSSLSPSEDEADKIEVGLWHCQSKAGSAIAIFGIYLCTGRFFSKYQKAAVQCLGSGCIKLYHLF